MTHDDFDSELERYLHARKHQKLSIRDFLSKIIPKRNPDRIDIETGVEIYDSKSLMERSKEKKNALFAHLAKRENATTDSSDIKEVAKIALSVIRQLSDDELKKFKQSADFEQLKEILKKHELIKRDV